MFGEYREKFVTPEAAAKVVKSGDWVDYTWCTNHPIALDKALAARQNELHDVKVRGGVTMWMPEICKAEDAGEHFTWNSWHCSGVDRKIIAKGTPEEIMTEDNLSDIYDVRVRIVNKQTEGSKAFFCEPCFD